MYHLCLPTSPVRQVAELISGLQALGCQNTKGEGQILCVISDSFNFLGNAEELQESGELPSDVDVIRVRMII